MKYSLLYILPHPDDESFGPGPVIARYIREGHQVHLLTLTKGGATKQRFKFNFSITEMGEMRHKEMLDVQKTLGLTSLTVLDLPDSGLKDMDPREIERIVKEYILKTKPDILLTYPVHGISGFYDHLVCHAVVKRVFVEMKGTAGAAKRLAFFGLAEDDLKNSRNILLKTFTENEIDCIVTVDDQDILAGRKALDCYATYREVVDRTNIKEVLARHNAFEFFMESYDPPLKELFENL